MRYLSAIILLLALIVQVGCSGNGRSLTQEQQDSIAQAKNDSIEIAKEAQRAADSIKNAREIERKELILKISKNFRIKKDEFDSFGWVYHNTTTKYCNVNSVHLYFQKDDNNVASNLRFCFQYEAGSWLFIRNIIFNIDGENITFVPNEMKTDCGYGGRIWEWCDELASDEMNLIEKIAKAKKS